MNDSENPYKTPEASLVGAVTESIQGAFRFVKDPNGLAKFVVFMLWLNLFIEVYALLSNGAQYSLLSSDYPDAEATANDQRQELINSISVLIYFVTAIPFGMWIYRAALNSHGFGARNLTVTPGWAVGWYFIPFANLVKPYYAMKEIFQVSINPENWQTAQPPATLRWWWGLWIGTSIAGAVLGKLPSTTVEQLQIQTLVSIGVGIGGILLDLVAIKLVKTITQNQNDLVSRSAERIM
jgi:hypothetical protein